MRGPKAISEIARQFKVHSNSSDTLEETVFDGGVSNRTKPEGEPESAELYEQIGRMKVELEWLKKIVENS